jgi:DNA-binding SARP family transcriptional activator
MIAVEQKGRVREAGMSGDTCVSVLGGFEVSHHGVAVPLPPASQRLLAYVALAGRIASRDGIAGALWSGEPEDRAHTNLRSAIARVGLQVPGLLEAAGRELRIAVEVHLDLEEARAAALGAIAHTGCASLDETVRAITSFSVDLLPGWYDDWVVDQAELWRQLRLHALEAVSRQLAADGRHAEAVVAAHAAVAGDPLRETPHAVLIEIHLREGNQSEAVRTFERYRRRLYDELGLEPTSRLREALGYAAVT